MNVIDMFFASLNKVFVHQSKEWGEIITGFETRNKYKVLDEQGHSIGFIAEQRKGLWALLLRSMLRSHRPLTIKVLDENRKELMEMNRPFYWFFSDLEITSENKVVGHIYQRFAFIFRRYDLADARGNIFARVRAPFWRIWTFSILNANGNEIAKISKKWGGILREVFTDADKFLIEFEGLTSSQKAVVFAAGISIDLDFFEENHKRR